jgi:CubicO group peptidase (beta-lactamase class C family)
MRGSATFHKLICILFCATSCVPAVAEPLDIGAYRRSLQSGVDSGAYDQVAVGWIDGDERTTWFLGKDAKQTLDTRFEIGALSEVFTALLFAQSAYEGKLRMHSTLRDAMPNFPFADSHLAATTLAAMATHRSGLPPIPPNLFPLDIDDPYANYSNADLRALLGNYRLSNGEGLAAYTPLDSGLLGFAVAQMAGGSLPTILHDKILAPLSMTRTGFDDASLLDGHAHGRVATHWHFGALAGAAGLRSSVGDLLDFLQINLRPPATTLRAPLLLVRQPQGERKPEVGLGWNIIDLNGDGQTWPMLWRASTTAGFSAFMAFRTDRQQALVLLGNTDTDLSRIGLAWMQGMEAPAAPLLGVAAASPSDLGIYAGLYKIRSIGTEIVVRATGQRLSVQLRGMPAIALQPAADDVFSALHGEAMMLSFQRDSGKVVGFVLDHGGMNLLAERLADQAPRLERKVMSVSQQRLAEFAGDFRLDALSFARITVDGGGLDMQLTGRVSIPLAAFAIDRFTDVDNSCEVTFRRDAAGIVNTAVISFAGVDRVAPRQTWRAPSAQTK